MFYYYYIIILLLYVVLLLLYVVLHSSHLYGWPTGRVPPAFHNYQYLNAGMFFYRNALVECFIICSNLTMSLLGVH